VRHIPHLVLSRPWEGDDLTLSSDHWHHLTRVLRLSGGDPVSYTDGNGRTGEGKLGDRVVVRGEERAVPKSSSLVVAVAPPTSRDRQRFLVEKLAELGVARLHWLNTRHGGSRVPGISKLTSWVEAAVEQSRGAWLMEVGTDLVTWEQLEPPVVVCAPGGSGMPPRATTVVVGPEGGLAPEEIPNDVVLWDLGPTILRVETAALVAAARLLG
jgi:16S rRNA (uracil1498-N3)-methyltransferase